MIFQAVICADEHDPDYSDLTDDLRQQGIYYMVIKSLTQIKAAVKLLDSNSPFLLYRNSLMRIDCPRDILQWHIKHPEFDSIAFRHDGYRLQVSFMPDQVEFLRDTVITKAQAYDKDCHPFIVERHQGKPMRVTFKRPQVDPPPIFVLGHNRPNYLRLALNSLMFSLDDTVPVYIFLNASPGCVVTLAREFGEKYPQVEVVELSTNIHHSAVSVALQLFQPENFIIWEDDFILPIAAKTLFPHWPYQFVSRLQYFDLVGWAPTVENIPQWDYRLGNLFPRTEYAPYDWVSSKEQKLESWEASTQQPLLLGQAVAMNIDFWRSCDKRAPWHVPIDSEILARAKRYCLPGLRGYHIGWNYTMDGYSRVACPDPPEEVVATLWKGQQTRHLRLDAAI